MTNVSCQMACYVSMLNSYHGQSPGYIGNYTLPLYNGVALGAAVVAGSIALGQLIFNKPEQSAQNQPAQSLGSKLRFRCVSVIKWTALTLAVASRVVALMDQGGFLGAKRPPSDYFPVWDLQYGLTHCAFQC